MFNDFVMKFYNREEEISQLNKIQKRSMKSAQLTVITGRRRIGKTRLLLEATQSQTTLYFFVARKSESYLCGDFQKEIQNKLDIPILGEVNSFGVLFEYLIKLSKERPFNLIIDEFQEFYHIAPSVFSEIQHHWDVNSSDSKMNLIVCGSVSTLMRQVFLNSKEPLFGRATGMIHVKPFKTSVLKQILSDYNSSPNPDDLLALYTFTGGVAKYVQLLIDEEAFTKEDMISAMIRQDSIFLQEGKNLLIEEFGKEYTTYFSILSAIARGRNTRAEIESDIGKEVGGYLTRMERDYDLIEKAIPIFSKSLTKNMRYSMKDNFLTFWFRFIYKYSYMLEIQGHESLKEIILRDYNTFSGRVLEKYFRDHLIEQKQATKIGGYWDRKGENEIDLIAVNEIKKTALVIEVKRNSENVNLSKLMEKGTRFLEKTGELKEYKISFKGLSLDDIEF